MNDTELDDLLDLCTAPAPPPSLRRGLIAALPVERRKIFGVPVRWAVAVAAAALCAIVGAAAFDNPELGRFYGTWDYDVNPLYMQTTRMVDPPIAGLKWWFLGAGYSIGGSGAVLHGSADMHNRYTHSFYGYEYTLDRVADGQYQVSFSPLQLSTLTHRMGPYKMNGRILPLPGNPAPLTVQVGQPFEVTLYQDGSERIYDRVQLSWTPFPNWPAKLPPSAQAAALRLAQPQLYVNGQLAATQPDAGSGPVIWVHLPGQGRYLATMSPQGNARFTQSGQVNGSTLDFQSEGTQFRIVCAQPIATGGARPLFVYHQQSFEDLLDPANPQTNQPFVGNAGPAILFK